MASDVTNQPSSTSHKRRQPTVATTTTAADPVLDQFQQMKSMISTFLDARQDPTPTSNTYTYPSKRKNCVSECQTNINKVPPQSSFKKLKIKKTLKSFFKNLKKKLKNATLVKFVP